MIFLTVGFQLPFDRLIRAVDEWQAARRPAVSLAQIAEAEYIPRNFRYSQFLTPDEFTEHVKNATVIVAHAGMGSIITGLQHGKPIVILPRRAADRETRNDHQLATARKLADRPGIHVAMEESDLGPILDRLSELENITPISPDASPELIANLRRFIAGD